MRLARVLVLCAIAALLASGVAAAKGTSVIRPGPFAPKNEAAARALAQERTALNLINRASRRVSARRRSCRPPAPTRTSAVTHDVPGQPVLDAIAALRRPATAADALPELFTRLGFGFGETYIDHVRAVTAANGQKFTIIIARSLRPSFQLSASCQASTRTELLALLDGKPRRLRAATLRILVDLRRQERDARLLAAAFEPRDIDAEADDVDKRRAAGRGACASRCAACARTSTSSSRR